MKTLQNAFEQERYSRQARFAPIGEDGQRKLRAARVAIAGCGALGCFQAGALARAGIGWLRLIDRDYVEWSNLQRQWLFEESDAVAALPKAVAAAKAIARINSGVTADAQVADLTARNAGELLGGVDLILDGTDNFETRFLINDFCVANGVPWTYGAAVGSYGLAMPVVPGRSACFRCIYPEPPPGAQPTCETAGVVNGITSLIASWQCSLACRLIVEGPEALPLKRMTADVWTGDLRSTPMPPRDPECPCCGLRRFEYLDETRRTPVSLCGRNAVQIHERKRPLDLEALARDLGPLGSVRSNGFALRFAVDTYEMTFFPDGRAIVKGTTDPGIARSLYSRYVGA